MKIEIFNNIEGKTIFKTSKITDFIEFVNKIKNENEDFDFFAISLSDCIDYINNYCDNLEIK